MTPLRGACISSRSSSPRLVCNSISSLLMVSSFLFGFIFFLNRGLVLNVNFSLLGRDFLAFRFQRSERFIHGIFCFVELSLGGASRLLFCH